MVKQRKKNGFTLLELIVVMAIIGILSTMMIGNFVVSQQRARDAKRKNDLVQIQRALEQYINDKGTYPAESSGKIVGCGSNPASPVACEWGGEFSLGLSPKTIYMIQLPEDIRTGYSYTYRTNSGATAYQLFLALENDEDKDIADYSFVTCGTQPCTYGVSSSNTTPATNPLN